MAITTPRCGHPVAYRAKNDDGTGATARCWKRAGHPGTKHLSRPAYEHELEHKRAYKRERKVRVLKPCGTEAAYRRHIRNREVPCEACRVAANKATDERRKAA